MKNTTKTIPSGDRRIADARRAFTERLERTPEKHRRAVVEVTAAKGIGFGPSQVDPFTNALARQMADAYKIQDRVEAAKREVAEIDATDTSGYRPRDPDYKVRLLGRKAVLEEAIEHDLARYVALQEDTLDSAKREAAEFWKKADAERERANQRQEALARAEADADQQELDSWAEGVVAARRGTPKNPAGETQ